MKITEKQLRLASGFFVLAGAIVSGFLWRYIGIGIIIFGMILMAPWVKDEDKK